MKQANIRRKLESKSKNRMPEITYPMLEKCWADYISNRHLEKINPDSFLQFVRQRHPGHKALGMWFIKTFVEKRIELLRKTDPKIFRTPEPVKIPEKIQPQPAPVLFELSAEFIEECWSWYSRYKDIYMLTGFGLAQYVNSEARLKFGAGKFTLANPDQMDSFIDKKWMAGKTKTL
ncbi:MAG: hypothetical protein FWG80_03895 [Alphaproteobacteria bacterium]|nr:hypothetical protein [Alphaproteobacteria bacterium]